MSNKDMPAYPPPFGGISPDGPAQPQEYTNEEIDELPGMWDASDLAGGEADSADRFRDCTLECGGLTTWCKCRADEAALAELEKRNG